MCSGFSMFIQVCALGSVRERQNHILHTSWWVVWSYDLQAQHSGWFFKLGLRSIPLWDSYLVASPIKSRIYPLSVNFHTQLLIISKKKRNIGNFQGWRNNQFLVCWIFGLNCNNFLMQWYYLYLMFINDSKNLFFIPGKASNMGWGSGRKAL